MNVDRDIVAVQDEVDRLLKSRRDIDRRIERKRRQLLRSLPTHHGFSNMDSLIRALAPFASDTLRAQIAASSIAGISKTQAKGKRYGADVRVAVRSALEEGEPPGKVARAHGLTLATIARWRELWGLKPKRTKRAVKGPAAASSNRVASSESIGAQVEGEACR